MVVCNTYSLLADSVVLAIEVIMVREVVQTGLCLNLSRKQCMTYRYKKKCLINYTVLAKTTQLARGTQGSGFRAIAS